MRSRPRLPAIGMYRSVNDGTSWQLVAADPTLGDASMLIMLAKPHGVLLAGVGITTDSAQILRSSDDGQSWTVPLPAAASHDAVIVCCAGTRGVVYCLGLHHLFRSPDGGTSWVMAAGAKLGTQADTALAALADGSLVVAQYGGLFQSRDGGDHWSHVP